MRVGWSVWVDFTVETVQAGNGPRQKEKRRCEWSDCVGQLVRPLLARLVSSCLASVERSREREVPRRWPNPPYKCEVPRPLRGLVGWGP